MQCASQKLGKPVCVFALLIQRTFLTNNNPAKSVDIRQVTCLHQFLNGASAVQADCRKRIVRRCVFTVLGFTETVRFIQFDRFRYLNNFSVIGRDRALLSLLFYVFCGFAAGVNTAAHGCNVCNRSFSVSAARFFGCQSALCIRCFGRLFRIIGFIRFVHVRDSSSADYCC